MWPRAFQIYLSFGLLIWNIMHSCMNSQHGLIHMLPSFTALDWTQASFSVSWLSDFTCMLSLCAFPIVLCEVCSSGFFQQRLVLGLAGTGTTDFKNLGENMQGCRKTQTSQTSITDDVCCPPTLPIPESHSASQPPVQPLLWRSEWETGPKGSVNPHYHHYPLACLVIWETLPVSPQNVPLHHHNVPGSAGPMEVISERSAWLTRSDHALSTAMDPDS